MDTWLLEFDRALASHYGIDHTEAGMDANDINCSRDLDPKAAALQFGEDYDLDRIHQGWR